MRYPAPSRVELSFAGVVRDTIVVVHDPDSSILGNSKAFNLLEKKTSFFENVINNIANKSLRDSGAWSFNSKVNLVHALDLSIWTSLIITLQDKELSAVAKRSNVGETDPSSALGLNIE